MKMENKQKFVVCVECAIKSGDKFLIIQRPQGVHAEGLLAFPGGKFELEDANPSQDVLIQAVKREVYEEVGIKLEGPIYYVTSSCFPDSKKEGDIVVDMIFYSQIGEIPKKLNVSEREVAEYHWLRLDECKLKSNCPEWLVRYLNCTKSLET